MTIGERIRLVRLDNDMSLRDFANVIGHQDTTVMKWEKGINKISFMDAIKICKRFKVSLNLLAGLGE